MRSIKNRNKEFKWVLGLLIIFSLYSNLVWTQQFYPASFDVTTLNGANGFIIPGIDDQSQFGAETKFIGDINNDGFEDIAIGVNNADVNGLSLAGAAYVIFGTNTGIPASFDITILNGTNGFAVEGIAGSTRMGSTVEGLGDINGDGIDDLAILSEGDAMVIYGKTTSFPATFNIDYADGVNGFLIQGFSSGNELANVGDINGDGVNDFAISRASYSQCIWVFYGRTSNFPAAINASSLNGVDGFAVKTYSNSSIPGFLVGGAGDINNDGIDDLIIGDWSSGFSTHLERTFLVYGRNTFPSLLDVEVMSITEGFTVDHTGGNFLAFTGALGDINNDGIDDFFSEKAAIYGRSGASPFPAHVPLSSVSDGTYGFVLPGSLTAASIGDINQDGINDFISVYGNSGTKDAYVVFGSTTGFPSPIDETTLNGTNGFVIPGFGPSNIGRPISGDGDFNGDGISDFIVGNPGAIPSGSTEQTGEAYVIFGGDHYAYPLNLHVVRNLTTSGFTLATNSSETGTTHYAIFPGTTTGTISYDEILSGTGAVESGDFLMSTTNTDIEHVISSLSANTPYDIYLFFEDDAGNYGTVFSGNDVTTLVDPATAFITTWQTTTANESITIPTIGGGYNYTVNWGDGTIENNQTGIASHTYATAGIHTVSISGDFPRIYFHPFSSPAGNNAKILTIEQWGDIEWTSMSYAFYKCSNLNITNTSIDTPDLSQVSNMGDMFYGASNFNYDIGNWDVSNVTAMRYTFMTASSFNQDLSSWDVSKVTNMIYMFWDATSFNQDISSWDVGSATNMKGMFYGVTSFDQNLSSWDVESVTDMTNMFRDVTLSTTNYDALLNGWSTQTLQSGVEFHGGNSKYCAAEVARQSILDTYGWTITDGGKVAASSEISPISDVNEVDGYTLPAIAGTDLSGNEKYYTETGGAGTAFEIGEVLNYADFTNYPVTLFAYDAGNSCGALEESFSLTIVLSDTTNPTASNPTPINVSCSGDVPTGDITVVTDEADDSGEIPTVAFVDDVSDGNSNPEVITRTYSVTDVAGNSINVEQTITVSDSENPTASNPAPINVSCSGDIPSEDISVVTDAVDNCTTTPTVAFVSDLESTPGNITRTYSVTDEAGNSINVEQIITVNDTENPTASNPSPINVSCSGDIPSEDISVVTDAVDNCTTTPIVGFVSDVESTPGTIIRTYSITDEAGNSINVEQTITVSDTENPTASNPSPVNVSCSGDIPSEDISVVTDAVDNCTTTPTVAFVSDLESTPGNITRTYSVTDEAGNSINVEQTITVNDTENPTA
ncbi:BspA family leucine-rich repeat surface protein, partial [Tamlana sp. 2_MG-2023]